MRNSVYTVVPNRLKGLLDFMVIPQNIALQDLGGWCSFERAILLLQRKVVSCTGIPSTNKTTNIRMGGANSCIRVNSWTVSAQHERPCRLCAVIL